jgi:3-hydroxyisobutyrate dehydrogenase-like beta-hydroxyacid dehydrogenase
MKATVGFVGLGQMGKWMALNILKKGYSLWVYDLNKEAVDELVRQGARAPLELTDLGNQCDWIVLSLPDTSAVESVIFGSGGLKSTLSAGKIIVDCSTTHPFSARQMAADLNKEGIIFLDAPISGMASRVREGRLTIMVGGKKETYLTIRPLLEAMGKTIVYMGGPGTGQLAKMINNVLFNISCAAMAEMLPMATKMGLDPESICSVVRTSSGQSYGFDFFSPLVLEGNFKPGYPMKNAYKDMALMMELSNKYQIPLPVASAAMNTYQMALARGLGGENKGAMIKVWENIFGVTVRKKNKEAGE